MARRTSSFAVLALCVGCGAASTAGPDDPSAAKAAATTAPSAVSAPAPEPAPLPAGARWRVGDVSLVGAEDLALSPGAHYVAKLDGALKVAILDARTKGLIRRIDAPQ